MLFIKFNLPVCFVVYLGTGAQSACKYTRFTERVIWQQAKEKCEQKGKRLARITNTNDVNDAADTSCVIGQSSDQKYWIGLKMDSSGTRFTWSDGSDSFPVRDLRCPPFQDCNFNAGQPCCFMHIEGNRYLEMVSCDKSYGYICENLHETCKYCILYACWTIDVSCIYLCICVCMYVCMYVYVRICMHAV